jgi:S1-C subfamily serine protease
MLRALILARLVSVIAGTSAVQPPPAVLHIKVVVKDADGKATTVPRYLLLVSDNPPTSTPRRVMTALDGTADVRLRPGNYTVESDQPFAFQGRTYSWTETLDVIAGRDAVLELTADNAEIVAAGAATASSSVETESAMLLAQWQDSVVTIWTPTALASGFAIDPGGLIATSQRAVGTGASIQVQLTPALKVAAELLGADAERGVAILRVDPKALAALRPVPAACGQPPAPAADQKVVTIGSTRRQQKRMTSGTISGRAAHLVLSDLMIGAASAGGPVFAVAGPLVGLTTLLEEEADGDARVVPIADVCRLLASVEKKMTATPAPSGAALPVEPSRPFPVESLREGARTRTASPAAYRMTSADYDLAFITPVMVYAVQNPSDDERRRQSNVPSRGPGAASLNPLENFSNWSGYVTDVPTVLLIRVTPRLVEGFWTKVARGAASTQGVSVPPIKRFRPGFSRLRAFCGDTEILPIHPFRLEQRVGETEAIYEGLYAFDPGALAPSCGAVKLTLYSEKDADKGDPRVVDPKVVQQIWDDFAPYRAAQQP